jgi:hypothetical protein
MIKDDEYYRDVDLPAYKQIVAPLLSGKILDIHAHARADVPEQHPHMMQNKYPGRKLESYPVEDLLRTAELMWPDQEFHALVFGMPTLDMRDSSNVHVCRECRRHETLYPLYIPDLHASEAQIRSTILDNGYLGFKPYWSLVESMVFKVFFDFVDPAKAMYGTDLPIMEMRGRRVCINGA